jgi:hypothetical protein
MEGTPLLYPLATKSAIGKSKVVLSWPNCRTGLQARPPYDGPGDPSYVARSDHRDISLTNSTANDKIRHLFPVVDQTKIRNF